ncbi:MAG: hypothetical protein JXR48_00885 [Candidatus Delongbacteria bacterium]|nr:hypothetical protein [Candidatus Delongbacteria bacterium]MBN2833498.1 hypothetical protein [Candidatus Delongbacteria bacterium]
MEEYIIKFTEFDWFYDKYRPSTVYGVIEKNRKKFICSKSELSSVFEKIETVCNFIKSDREKISKIEFHLKKLPELPNIDKANFDTSELFLFKKFLINYRTISNILPANIKLGFGLEFSSEELIDLLSKGNNRGEMFHISDDYNVELSKIREEVRKKEVLLKEVKKSRLSEILIQTGFDFRFQDFAVINGNSKPEGSENYIFVEPYDQKNIVIKPILTEKFFSLRKELDYLIDEEKKYSDIVKKEISGKIKIHSSEIKRYISSITEFDIVLTKSVIAIKYNMVKPEIEDETNQIICNNGIYLPLKESCDKRETTYTPLSLDFNKRINVVTGSNMGGKTVLLKSLGFFQLLVQYGFYVPAEKFSTTIFDNISFAGEVNSDTSGLSSFGFEIFNFNKALEKSFTGKVLILMDEFARTTNSFEAEALTNGVLQKFGDSKNIFSVFSTHFMKLEKKDFIDFFRMEGLNFENYSKVFEKKGTYSHEERIKLINSFMSYRVLRNSDQELCQDALYIAHTLGLDTEIINYARQFLGGKKC